MGSFEFGILEVATLIGLRKKERISGRSVDACCPFCGDKRFHLNLNLQKNAFRCNKCGESGGMLQLYGRVMGVDNKEAYRAIREALRLPENERIKTVRKEVKKAIENSESEGAPPNFEKIHKVYTALFDELTLSVEHKKNLMHRGLPEGIINANKYKTIPSKNKEYEFAERLLKRCGISDFIGVPGFYTDDEGKWKANFGLSGFLIPVRNFNGQIVGAQIRSDSGTPKYLAFSSSYRKDGTKATSAIHCVGRFVDYPKVVYITEGPLKADIAHFYTGQPFLAVQGVNNQKYVEPIFKELRKLGVERICECFDMDKHINPQVQKAVVQIEEKAKNLGFSFSHMAWDTHFKGIDDYLCHKYGAADSDIDS